MTLLAGYWLNVTIGLLYLLAWPLLFCCLVVTGDWRKRKVFSDGTSHLEADELDAALSRNMRIVRDYLSVWPKPPGTLRGAENALVMATVLRQHQWRLEGRRPIPGYLRTRRKLRRDAARMARAASSQE